MPMPLKGARLLLRNRPGREPVWVIKDGPTEISTGTADSGQAEIALAAHITKKNRQSGPAKPDEMTVAEALSAYGEEHAPHCADPARIGYAIQALLPFWGELAVSAIKGETCRRYAKTRKRNIAPEGQPPQWVPIKPDTIRRELATLGAALNFCAAEGYLITAPKVTKPAREETGQRALTRSEAAKIIRIARKRGQHHIARFTLISLYTGTRKSAVLNLRLSGPYIGGGWFDLDAGVLYRIGDGEKATNKRRTPARIPRQLAAHARRWKAMGMTWAVEFRGARVADIKTAWGKIADEAKLGWHPTPHTLKHTAITWAMRKGVSIEDASGYFSTSIETIQRTYWHLSPHFQSSAVEAIEGKTGRTVGRQK